jgi:hypothetical protein
MLAGDVFSLSGDGMVGRRHVGRIVAALRPRLQGGAVVSVERGFGLEDVDWDADLPGPAVDHRPSADERRGCDPMAGSTAGRWRMTATTATGALHRLDPDLSVVVVLDGVTISNVLDWSPDGSPVARPHRRPARWRQHPAHRLHPAATVAHRAARRRSPRRRHRQGRGRHRPLPGRGRRGLRGATGPGNRGGSGSCT